MKKKTDDQQIPQRAALYARVSSQDQRERQTIDAQVDALVGAAPHQGLEIVDQYLDDGWSGTLPMGKRPEGARLVEDAKAKKFDVVFFYKLDRLARSLRTFLDIVDFFEEAEIGLKSMTEPFDTTSPMGKFAVTMMAGVAELERDTIIERTAMGRERIAKKGRWTGGVVPYGYRLDQEGYLTPDTEPREGYSFSEVEIIQRIFRMVADEGVTAMATARKLNEEGITAWRKYHAKGNKDVQYQIKSGRWWATNISRIIRSETYKGIHVWDAKDKNISREVPALVDPDIWERANQQLTKNKLYPNRGTNNLYLLRGLIRCSDCGKTYGGFMTSGKGSNRLYYRCGSQVGESARGGQQTCNGKLIPAEWLEDRVWEDISAFVMNPGEVVHKLKERMESELDTVSKGEARKRELEKAINLKEGERARTLDLYKWGLLTVADLDKYVQQHRKDLEPLQAEMAGLLNEGAEQGQKVGKLTDAGSLLKALQDRIQGQVDWDTKRKVVELLVWGISVKTKGTGRKKKATVEIIYAFEPKPFVAVNGIG